MAKRRVRNAQAQRARPAGKRDLVRRPKASANAKRTARGRFKEMEDVGRSQKADKPRKAKRTVSSGYGDQGDERRRATRKETRPLLSSERLDGIHTAGSACGAERGHRGDAKEHRYDSQQRFRIAQIHAREPGLDRNQPLR